MTNSFNREYQEKRNFIRMKIEAPAQISVSIHGENYDGICRELSGGGMLVELDTTLPIDTEVEVNIHSTHGHSPMLKARAKIVREIPTTEESEKPFQLGMEIIELIE